MLDGYSKHCTFPYRPCESCSKHDVSAVPEAWRTTPMPSSLFQIRILSTMPVYIPLSPVTRETEMFLDVEGFVEGSKIVAFDHRHSFPIFLLFSYVSRHRTIKFTRTSKAIEQKRFENKYRNIGEDAFVGDVNHRRQRRFDIVVSMSIHPSVLFSSLDSFPSTLSSEYWLLGANGLRYRLIQMRTGFHSKLDGATVSAML